MANSKRYIVQVEPAKPSDNGKPAMGPVYRSTFGVEPHIPGMDSCWDIFRMSVETHPDNPMLGHRDIVDGKHGDYVWLTYKQVFDIVIKVGNAIRSCDVKQGGRCGIYGANSEGWIISMEACNAHGLYCVPLYDTLGASAVEFVICHAEVSIVFAEEKKIPEVFKTFPKTAEYIKTIVSFGKITSEQREEAAKLGLTIYSWDEFLVLGDVKHFELPVKTKSDICTIMYTSGTTGDPKGVLISNNSIVTLVAAVNRFLQGVKEPLTVNDVYLSYLPLAHIFDRIIEECFISHGAQIGFWRGDVKLLVEDIGVLKPTVFCAVPRVLDRIYSGLTQKISSGGFLKNLLFNIAYSYKSFGMNNGHKHEEAAPLFDKFVFDKVKKGLGGRVRLILSGAAPLANHVESYLKVVTCCHVLQGYGSPNPRNMLRMIILYVAVVISIWCLLHAVQVYLKSEEFFLVIGLTETCAGSFVSIPNEQSMMGTVGPPVPNVDARLESVPEMGYDALSDTPRGEICIRGETLFSGYYKREDLTKEVLVDGWFHTGDIGEWQPNGAMKIVDRKKNIFKLSQGEYVAVENLENIYGLVAAIDSIWVYGNSFESFLVAVVNPNMQAIEHWSNENSLPGDFHSLCQNEKVKEYILGELSKIGKEKKLKGFEIIRAVHLDPVPFDMDRDLITPTFKKKRPQMLKYYQNIVDSMYKK